MTATGTIQGMRAAVLPMILLAMLLPGTAQAAPRFSAGSVAIFDLDSGAWLYRKSSRTMRPPASTIKILTALTAISQVTDPGRFVTISDRSENMEPSKAGLRAGEQYRLIDLIEALLVASCNDAAVAIAEGVSGSESAFARDMQEYAKKLGCVGTRITNASGLPEPGGMLTTAEDSIIFIRKLREDKRIFQFMSVKKFILRSREGREIELINHNRLLWKYPYVVRGKTGYTRLAGHCFLSYGEHGERNVTVSVLGSSGKTKLWQDVQRAYSFCFQTKAAPELPAFMRSQGISIAQLQAALAKAGFPLGGEEHSYGPLTRAKVSAFQKSRKLDTDGVVGPHTWRALEAEAK